MPNASELLNSIQESFGLKKKQPKEGPAAGTLPVVPAETSALPEMPAAPIVAPAGELPDWLSAPSPVEPVLAPLPEPEVPVVEAPVAPAAESPAPVLEAAPELPAVEVQAPIPEAKAESDPFAINREFNGYMETIRQAQAVLSSGIALNPEEQRNALIAVARSNSLLPKLPPEVLESVLLMRAVVSGKPKFSRDDFQREMLGAMSVIKGGVATRG